jgi:hypothetical protein
MRYRNRFLRESEDSLDELIDILPHGSGIDSDWEVISADSRAVVLGNSWHYMSQNGYYLGYIDFELTIKSNGSFDVEWRDSIRDIARSSLGKDIAEDVNDGEPVSRSEVQDLIEYELNDILDHIYQTIDNTAGRKLAKYVKMI